MTGDPLFATNWPERCVQLACVLASVAPNFCVDQQRPLTAACMHCYLGCGVVASGSRENLDALSSGTRCTLVCRSWGLY